MNPEYDQVRCGRCNSLEYKDDCLQTDDGSWLCENCQDKYDRIPNDIEEDR